VVGVTVSAFGYTICRTKDAKRRKDNPLIWDVTCEFSSDVDERQSSQNVESDPESWIPVYETKWERLQEVVTKDFAGTSIANSAGQPFETGLTIGRFIPVWEFFQFESASVTDETIIARNERVNAGVFKGRAAKTLLITVMSSVIGYYYGNRRRLTQYSIKYNSRNWKHKRLDVGTVYLSAPDVDTEVGWTPIMDDNGNNVLGALDGSGNKQLTGVEPATLEFDMYETIDFGSFLRT